MIIGFPVGCFYVLGNSCTGVSASLSTVHFATRVGNLVFEIPGPWPSSIMILFC